MENWDIAPTRYKVGYVLGILTIGLGILTILIQQVSGASSIFTVVGGALIGLGIGGKYSLEKYSDPNQPQE